MFVCFFGTSHYRVRFLDKESALKGFGTLLRSGGGEYFDKETYGFNSARQLELLKQSGIKFELIEPKEGK